MGGRWAGSSNVVDIFYIPPGWNRANYQKLNGNIAPLTPAFMEMVCFFTTLPVNYTTMIMLLNLVVKDAKYLMKKAY